MMGNPELEEKLREAACFGDIDGVKELLNRGVNVNAQHDINGWTALHWAAKRNHLNIVNLLCNHGADKNVPTNKGEVAAQLTSEGVIKVLLNAMKGSPAAPPPKQPQIKKEDPLPITPNYIRSPPLNYEVDLGETRLQPSEKRQRTKYPAHEESNIVVNKQVQQVQPRLLPHQLQQFNREELILKLRIANSPDTDFIEIELPTTALTLEYLIVLGCEELGISPHSVERVRKLPNTRLRRDKEVERLENYQEIEFIIKLEAHEITELPVCNGVSAMEEGTGEEPLAPHDQTQGQVEKGTEEVVDVNHSTEEEAITA